IANSDFVDNTSARSGGGIYIYGPLSLSNGQFDHNVSQNGDGGGLFASSTLELTATEFTRNQATRSAGAVYQAGGTGRLVNTRFANNAAGNNGTDLTVMTAGDVSLLHLTIDGVISSEKAAIVNGSGNLEVINSIISNHAIAIKRMGGIVTEDYNLFYGNITNTVGVTNGAHSLVGDPRFVDPAHDGYHLAFGSAAIDHGIDVGVYTDLDGNLRPHGAGFDIGAYEFMGDTRYVATTGDDASNLCLDQLSPCATVQHAIDVANDGDQVLIASGLYTQSTTLSKPVSLTGVNSDTTILHAVAGQRVLTVTGATISNSVVISGLTFTGGNVANGYSCPDGCGGGIAVLDQAQPLLHSIQINGNTAATGGGLFNDDGSPLTLRSVALRDNTATYEGGGCLANAALQLEDTDFIHNMAQTGAGLATPRYHDPVDVSMQRTRFLSNTATPEGLVYGGGAYVSGRAIVSESVFENNSFAYGGGGLWAYEAIITDSAFISNTGVWGGGLTAYSVAITNGYFERNSSISAGGGVRAISGSISNTQFISNTTDGYSFYTGDGGGGAYFSAEATIVNSRFEGNRCRMTICKGGGFLLSGFPNNLVVDNSVFINNSTLGDGGGLYVDGPVTMTNSQFISNSASLSGGAFFYSRTESSPAREGRIVNTLFSRNSATVGGAALYLETNDTVTILHTTIADVPSSSTSAIAIAAGTLNLTNTLIANHTIGISNTGGLVTEDYNLYYGNLTNTVGVTNGAHSLIGDPRFVDPAHDDYHLALDSAAIDHGIDAGVYTDLDGNPRPIGAGFDIGAYEYQGMIYRAFLPVILR
ncbi:MAG: hypothetical protein HY870_25315, partial [Chloroflexi bacterium]|nr:hypothetical protein [Chloroflexota bacterium]